MRQMIIRFIRWTGWTLTMTMVIDDSTINIAVVISVIAITGVWQMCLQPLCMYLNNRIRKMRQVNWTMFCTWNVKLLYAAMWSIEWKKDRWGSWEMERNISHLESKNKNWQKRTRLLAAKHADHNWITETSYVRYKITTNNTERREKNHNTCF